MREKNGKGGNDVKERGKGREGGKWRGREEEVKAKGGREWGRGEKREERNFVEL